MKGKPFGPWLGSLFSFIVFAFSQILAFASIFFLGVSSNYFHKNFGFNLTISALISSIFSLILIYLFIFISKYPLKEYLSLKKFSLESFIFWFLLFGSFIGISEYLLYKFNISTVPEFLKKAYFSTDFPLLLFFVIIFVYPLFEEVLFRGFFFKSLENSKIGGTGAVLITSFFWSVLHIQYNLWIILVIFIAGVIFGMSRLKTNSLYLPLTLHILQNLASSIFFYFSLN